MNNREQFYKMLEESKSSVENFNDYSNDNAIIWAANKIAEYEEEIKNLTEGYGFLLKENHNLKDIKINKLHELYFEGETAPEVWLQQEIKKLSGALNE